MNWEFNEDTPIYMQIVEQIRAQIASGKYKPGEKLPSVRELAIEAQVNPNTMQKALTELERSGLLYSQRTAGRYVSDNVESKSMLKKELADNYASLYMTSMAKIGYSKEQSLEHLQEYSKKEH